MCLYPWNKMLVVILHMGGWVGGWVTAGHILIHWHEKYNVICGLTMFELHSVYNVAWCGYIHVHDVNVHMSLVHVHAQ